VSLLLRALLRPYGEPLVVFRYAKHHSSGGGVTHLLRQNTRLLGSLPPMFGVIENVRNFEKPN
jgi:hypothetical protein